MIENQNNLMIEHIDYLYSLLLTSLLNRLNKSSNNSDTSYRHKQTEYNVNTQLLDEAEHDIRNYLIRGQCYLLSQRSRRG